MPTAVRAAVSRARGAPFTVEELELDDPRPDELLVRLAGTGCCHTDVVVRDQHYPVPQPIVGGHEGAGTVEAVGDAVRGFAPGDAVVLCNASCGTCRMCRTGRPSYCLRFSELNFSGTRADGSTTLRDGAGEPVHGSLFGQSSFATYALATERGAVRMPRDAPLDLLGPLGCGIQTGAGAVLNALRPPAGTSLAVFGAGSVGLSAVMAARLVGCHPVVAVEPRGDRRELALELGATHAVDPAAEDPVEAVRGLTGGEGAHRTLECVGDAAVLRSAVDALAQGGECGLVGAAPMGTEASVDISALLFGRRITGIVEGSSVPQVFIPRLWELRQAGLFPYDRLVRRYPLDEVNTAMADAFDDPDGPAVKPVLTF